MKSPFPGMDPYLERHWSDVHGKLAVYTSDELNELLPADLAATTEERVAIESREDRDLLVGPDVSVGVISTGTSDDSGGGGVILEAPFKLQVALDPMIERFVRIVDQDGRLVTILEYVSPTNKRGQGLRAFRRKRAELLAHGVNLVEIDLVRGGSWRSLMRPEECPEGAESTYRVTIRTAGPRGNGYLFPIGLRDLLPTIPVPLRREDTPVTLDLQKMLNFVYSRGRYAARLRYDRPLRKPLDPDDAAWAQTILNQDRSVGQDQR